MAQWAHYSIPDPEFSALGINGPIGREMSSVDDIPVIRKLLTDGNEAKNKAVLAEKPALETDLIVKDYNIPVDDGNISILARVYIPKHENDNETFPVVIDFHGGGLCFGSLANDDIKCRTLCLKYRVVVVNVDYRLAPEHPYPAGVNDSWSAVHWVFQNAKALHGDHTKGFVLLGISSGAYLSIVVTHRARNDPLLRGVITGQHLQVPPTAGPVGIAPEKYKDQLLSFEQNTDDVVLIPANIKIIQESVRAPPPETAEISPILSDTFSDLPPTVLQVAGGDPLRDEGLLYHKLLSESGVETKLHIYPGLPHAFPLFFPSLKASQKWQEDYEKGLQWLLGHDA